MSRRPPAGRGSTPRRVASRPAGSRRAAAGHRRAVRLSSRWKAPAQLKARAIGGAGRPLRSSSRRERQRPHRTQRRDDRQRHDGLPRPAGPVVEVEREPLRQVDDLGREVGHVVPRPDAEQRQPQLGEDPGGLQTRRSPRMNSSADCRCGRVDARHRPDATRRTPRSSSTDRPDRRSSWPRCRRRAAASGSSGPPRRSPASVRMPRNSRSSRSSASIVTLVSSSPFHQPASSCIARSRPTARSSVARRRLGAWPPRAGHLGRLTSVISSPGSR